jgi:hypothetical protein
MDEKERQLLTETIETVAELKVQAAALQELVIALAVALTEKTGASMADIYAIMEVIRLLAVFRKGDDIAGGMKYVTDNLDALCALPPLKALLLSALQHQQAGDSRRAALQSWLAQATSGEIQQDLLQVLRTLLSEPAGQAFPPRGADESPGAS